MNAQPDVASFLALYPLTPSLQGKPSVITTFFVRILALRRRSVFYLQGSVQTLDSGSSGTVEDVGRTDEAILRLAGDIGSRDEATVRIAGRERSHVRH